jgi:tRNA (cmo5U34)-methyltransferase
MVETPEKNGSAFTMQKSWTFNRPDIADVFDKHVREQLPWYEIVTRAITQIARHYISQNGLVYDIGASTGNIGRAIHDLIVDRNAHLIAIEKSKEMAEKYKAVGELIVKDALEVDYEKADLIICNLVLMFLRPEDKTRLINKLIVSLRYGGALVIVDKRASNEGYIGTILGRLTLSEKLNAGVTPERIITKELSLAGIQRPMNPEDIPEGAIEFFRFGEFSGWILERERVELLKNTRY